MNKLHAAQFCLALIGTIMPVTAQEDPVPGDPAPEEQSFADRLDAFRDVVRDPKLSRDAEGVRMVDQLVAEHETLEPRQQRALLEEFRKVFLGKKRKPKDPELYRAVVFGLGRIGGRHAAQVLAGLIDTSPWEDRDRLALVEDIFENLGRTHEESQVELLMKKATRDHQPEIQRAAGKALRHFADLPLRKRQEMFRDLLRAYEEIESRSKSGGGGGNSGAATARERLAMIRGAWNATLSDFSGASCRTAADWNHWWNDNKEDRKAWK